MPGSRSNSICYFKVVWFDLVVVVLGIVTTLDHHFDCCCYSSDCDI